MVDKDQKKKKKEKKEVKRRPVEGEVEGMKIDVWRGGKASNISRNHCIFHWQVRSSISAIYR